MSDIICVTNRSLCREDFLQRLEEIAECQPKAIILREKDLTEAEYRELAEKALRICGKYRVPCMLHSFYGMAKELSADKIHLPLPILRRMSEEDKKYFTQIGASCHSVSDAAEAQRLGCTYITAGHIFETGCKKGLPGRGVDFLKSVCGSVSIPVYAIGGIDSGNAGAVIEQGARGVCVMSGPMQCENVKEYMNKFEREGEKGEF